jgi:uncharacterized DUF497 family protein
MAPARSPKPLLSNPETAREALLMRFEWDEHKNRRNLAKHKVSFETAKLAFEDPDVLSIQDRVIEGEERWQTLGMVSGAIFASGPYLSGRR